ncbi:hypothetical protein ABZ897_53715 [Nonomuraea sp. NPDC046802]|uniref:hypothetical protein n=1 Tax=Nonomuraea sp. NPDC046802 TaxID=3154919 RepID=UPI0033E75121
MRRMKTLCIAGIICADILAVCHFFEREFGWAIGWAGIALVGTIITLFVEARHATPKKDTTTEPFAGYEIQNQPQRFIGLTVNLVTKDGSLWERTTIKGVDRGELLLSGGTFIPQIYADPIERRPVTEPRHCRVYTFEVARGLVHRT